MTMLSGKAAIVTGAGGAIGRATALLLARQGAWVLCADRNADTAARTADAILAAGGHALSVKADITDEAEVAAMVAAAVAAFGTLDVLVNNAGGSSRRDVDIASMDAAVWDRTMALNARGTMLCCKHALPQMLAQGAGAIVNISSGAATAGQLSMPAYAASKSAVLALTRAIATQHGREGIRCNAITPGLILHENLAPHYPEAHVRIDAANILSPRQGTVDDIANAVLFLASEMSAFVNGHVLPVDGGLFAHTPTYAQTLELGLDSLSLRN
jgi:NAD(P)-dependent dehydrogenase (short-subunit alcohol dehydrogenase family)